MGVMEPPAGTFFLYPLPSSIFILMDSTIRVGGSGTLEEAIHGER
jgi:hypothetical protein